MVIEVKRSMAGGVDVRRSEKEGVGVLSTRLGQSAKDLPIAGGFELHRSKPSAGEVARFAGVAESGPLFTFIFACRFRILQRNEERTAFPLVD